MPLSTTIDSLSELNHRHAITSVSTNSELIEALQSNTLATSERQLLTAETQTAGRGQHTRSWQSPAGNVYLSLYHPIDIAISGLLSLIVGLELAKMPIIQTLNERLERQGKPSIGVKWANDLGFYTLPEQDKTLDLAKNNIIAFSKLAGILIEPVLLGGKLTGVVIGVGLNVAATPKLTMQTLEGMSYQALSLRDVNESLQDDKLESLPSLTLIYHQISQALLNAIHCFKNIAAEKSNLQTNLDERATTQFNKQFEQHDALKNLRIRITQNLNNKEHVIEGLACGIDTNGCLQLKQDNGNISALFTGRIDVINEA